MSDERFDKLDRLREPAIAALLSEPTLEAAARKIGVFRHTLSIWVREDIELSDHYRAIRGDLLRSVVDELLHEGSASIRKLVEIRDEFQTRAADKIRACVAILDQLHRGFHLVDLTDRVETIEKLLREAAQHASTPHPGQDTAAQATGRECLPLADPCEPADPGDDPLLSGTGDEGRGFGT